MDDVVFSSDDEVFLRECGIALDNTWLTVEAMTADPEEVQKFVENLLRISNMLLLLPENTPPEDPF